MAFDKEADFEQELFGNWANILFEDNCGILCMRPELSAINADNFIVPIWSI
jgi:hypothetical protein